MQARLRTWILLAAAVGSFIYAFIESNPAWIGAGGALLGGEALAHAKPDGKDE